MANATTLDSVMAALRSLQLNAVRDIKIDQGKVSLKVSVANPSAEYREQVRRKVEEALVRIAGAIETNITVESESGVAKPAAKQQEAAGIPGVKHIVAVSSGKGGVGKSTVSTNLAVALAKLGHKVGLLDTDIYGPNIPTMMGVQGPPHARQDEARGELIIPLEAHGVKVMSMGFLSRGDQPMVWRGPMLHSVVHQFLNKVDWGTLDYLVVDMPPGTGDVQLSLTQMVALSGAVVVTTPQEVAAQDVRKAILMFEKVNVPTLGIVENMSYFVCGKCDERHEIFGRGAGQELSEKYRTKLLAQLPLVADVREAGDSGTPIMARSGDSAVSASFAALAKNVVAEIDYRAGISGTAHGAAGIEIVGF